MNISKELIEKAKTAKTAEELLEMAKVENIEISAEEAAKAFAELNKTGELSDEELDNVSGGGCGDSNKSGDTPKYSVGQRGCTCVGPNKVYYVIEEVLPKVDGTYQYRIRYEGSDDWVECVFENRIHLALLMDVAFGSILFSIKKTNNSREIIL